MTGEWALLGVVAVLLLAILLILVAWLVYETMSQARSVIEHQHELVELVSQQAALIASADALSYQAIRAADAFSSYDGANSPALTEEDSDGDGADGLSEHIETGDPFLDGKLFAND